LLEGRGATRAISPLAACALSLACLGGSPAKAQVNATASLFNDLRLRGYSLSDGRPVGILDLSYDAPNGLYGAVSGSIVASRGEGLKPLGIIVNGGYATRVSPQMSLDLGVTHSSYSKYSDRAASLSYTEIYAGISGKLVSARVNLSPDYVKGGSAYGELNGNWPLGKNLSFTAHAGLVVPFRTVHPGYRYSEDLDWRLGIARIVGPISIEAAWSAVRPGQGAYRDRRHKRDALIIGLTYSL
jgi:uncharacterized protein (TIGR02001 family)